MDQLGRETLRSAAFFGEPHLRGFRVSYAYLTEGDMNVALTGVAEELQRFA